MTIDNDVTNQILSSSSSKEECFDKPQRSSFTPSARQSELEALRQRKLTTQLNRHFNEQVAKETAALQSAMEHFKKRQEANKTNTVNMSSTTKTTTIKSANQIISPLDAVYLSITKWRKECRQKERETLLRNQRYASQIKDLTLSDIKIDAKATSKDDKDKHKVELATLEIPVSDAAKHIETALEHYLKAGALEVPSLESLGKDVTYAQAYHEQCMADLIQACEEQWTSKEVDARCTPTADKINTYVGPGAFQENTVLESGDNSDETSTNDNGNIQSEVCLTTEKEMKSSIIPGADGSSIVDTSDDSNDSIHDRISLSTEECSKHEINDYSKTSMSGGKEYQTDNCVMDPMESLPALIASTRSTDSTYSFSTKNISMEEEKFIVLPIHPQAIHQSQQQQQQQEKQNNNNPNPHKWMKLYGGMALIGMIGVYYCSRPTAITRGSIGMDFVSCSQDTVGSMYSEALSHICFIQDILLA